jgi:hypothetical protein
MRLPGGGTARALFDGLGRFVDWQADLAPAAPAALGR